MKDAKGHGSDPRGGIAHQSGIMGLVPPAVREAMTKDRLTSLVPPGSKTDKVVKMAAKLIAAELIPGGSIYATYKGAQWAYHKLHG